MVTELFRWACVGLAIVAACVGIGAGLDYGIAVPAALVAVGAGGLAIWDTSQKDGRRPSASPSSFEAPTVGVRAWFTGGSLGREEIVLLLDRLDREGPRPALPVRPPEELRRVVELPVREFRLYVRARLERLEGAR